MSVGEKNGLSIRPWPGKELETKTNSLQHIWDNIQKLTVDREK